MGEIMVNKELITITSIFLLDFPLKKVLLMGFFFRFFSEFSFFFFVPVQNSFCRTFLFVLCYCFYMKGNFLLLFVGFLLISCNYFPIICTDSRSDITPFLETTHIFEVTDFDLFTLHRNSLMVDSVKTNSSLHFSYNENYSTLNEESYIYNFGNIGTCSDFSCSLNLNYSYISLFGKLEILFGDNSNAGFRGLYFCSIYDLNPVDTGTYETIALFAPYLYEWRSAGLLLSDSITFNMNRIGDNLGLYITSESELKVSNSYRLLETFPVSFILIKFTPYSGSYAGTDFSFDFTGISAELNIENHSPINPGGFAWLISNPIVIVLLILFLVGFLGTLFYVLYIRARKKNKSKLKEKIELEDFDLLADNTEFSRSETPIESVFNKELILSLVPIVYEYSKYGTQKCAICKIRIKENRIIYRCPNCQSYFHVLLPIFDSPNYGFNIKYPDSFLLFLHYNSSTICSFSESYGGFTIMRNLSGSFPVFSSFCTASSGKIIISPFSISFSSLFTVIFPFP